MNICRIEYLISEIYILLPINCICRFILCNNAIYYNSRAFLQVHLC